MIVGSNFNIYEDVGIRNYETVLLLYNTTQQYYYELNLKVLTSVYDTQNFWSSGLCPSSGTLKTRKHYVSETGSVSVLRWEEDTCFLESLRKS
jgi:hypothetical protein